MALEPYSSCPCGSGKKFKWCCQPIHVQIDKAFRQEADGQHEVALHTMAEVVAQHPTNPEAWGRQAQLLYLNGRTDDAENALQKAFEINPNYPFGHLLRGMFRQTEGEIPGAVMLFRKATELYDPEAHDQLGQLFAMIGDAELKMNRPVAGHAALKLALRHQPGNEQLRKEMDEVFGDKSPLPASAKKEYAFRSQPATATAERRTAWDRALEGAGTGKLSAPARAFEQLTQENADDAAAWYNLGLVRAWLGDNRGALEALDRSVTVDTDEPQAAAAWALGEVLRLGFGMEDLSDYLEHAFTYRLRNPQLVVDALQAWERTRRLVILGAQQEEGVLTGLILERVSTLSAQLGRDRFPRLGAYLLVVGDHIRLWNTDAEALEKIRDELQQAAGQGLAEERPERRPANFSGPFGSDVLLGALSFPVGVSDKEEAIRGAREQEQRYFEETWLHRPLRSLNGVPPVDAAGHAGLRKKLLGVVQFLQECATSGGRGYDFDRLRRKLGLLAPEPAAAGGGGAAGPDIGAMGAAELAGLQVDGLSFELLEQAYQTALKLDARELAGRFAQALVARPPQADRPDRYPWYAHLVQLKLAEGDTDGVLNLINEGEKADCEQNEGRRRNDYELRRAQIHARRGEADVAHDLFNKLIERVPSELRIRGSAAEAMLAARQGARALQFAEQGLGKAREQNNRDSEAYFQELVAAARKQGA